MLVTSIVPCGDPEAIAAALASAAGPLVLDLGDPRAPGNREARRRMAAAVLSRHPRAPAARVDGGARSLILRVAPLASGLVDGDLDAVMAGAPDAVLLPGAVGARDIGHLAAKLAVREAEHGLPPGTTGILAAAADTAQGLLALGSVPGASSRLDGLVWDPAALASDLGTGPDSAPCGVARALLLAAAAAAGVSALDAAPVGPDPAAAVDAARRDGFSGRLIVAAPERAAGRPWLGTEGRGR